MFRVGFEAGCFVSTGVALCIAASLPSSILHLSCPSQMTAMADSTPQISSLSIHSTRNNPIDLTHDDEEPGAVQYHSPRSKRAYSDSYDSRSAEQCPPSRYQTISPSTVLDNAIFPSSTPDHHPPPQSPVPQLSNSSPYPEPYRPPYLNQMNHMNYMNHNQPSRQQSLQPPQLSRHFYQHGQHMQHMHPTPPPFPQGFRPPPPPPLPYLSPAGSVGHQVIDLTDSPSPPPAAAYNVPPGLHPVNPDDPPKTPVCIGQLVVNALVLYPISYLLPRDQSQDFEWASVRLQYEHNPHRMGNSETIHIRTPSDRTQNGEIISGDNFAVVEQKVATGLGGMLGKGLIRLEARIRRGNPNVRVTIFWLVCGNSCFFCYSYPYCHFRCSCTPQRETSWLLATICNSAICCWIIQAPPLMIVVSRHIVTSTHTVHHREVTTGLFCSITGCMGLVEHHLQDGPNLQWGGVKMSNGHKLMNFSST